MRVGLKGAVPGVLVVFGVPLVVLGVVVVVVSVVDGLGGVVVVLSELTGVLVDTVVVAVEVGVFVAAVVVGVVCDVRMTGMVLTSSVGLLAYGIVAMMDATSLALLGRVSLTSLEVVRESLSNVLFSSEARLDTSVC